MMRRRALASALVALMAAVACSASPPVVQPDGRSGAKAVAIQNMEVDGQRATATTCPPGTLCADLEWATGNRLRVRYRLRNAGHGPLLAFDRGDTHAVLVKRQRAGDIGPPQVEVDGQDMTLTHRGRPLPSPAPTVPPIPLVTQIASGGDHQGTFDVAVPAGARPTRVRYCLGVTAMDAPLPDEMQFEPGVWQVTPDQIRAQSMLCSQWIDVPEPAAAA